MGQNKANMKTRPLGKDVMNRNIYLCNGSVPAVFISIGLTGISS